MYHGLAGAYCELKRAQNSAPLKLSYTSHLDNRTVVTLDQTFRIPSRRLLLATIAFASTACASTGATFQSGVGDRYLDRAPYYAGRDVSGDSGRIGHFPVAWQGRDRSQTHIVTRVQPGSVLDSLLIAMTAYVDSLGISNPISTSTSGGNAPLSNAPDVRFGCITQGALPVADCADRDVDSRGNGPRDTGASGRGRQEMLLAVGRPSSDWVISQRALLASSGNSRSLVIVLEVGEYWMRQEGITGTKVIELGTDHRKQLPWLTSLDTPVSVLQLTAALVDADGRAVRIGAEGVHARRTGLLASAIGAQAVIGDDDIRALASARRDDLPGQPLVWQVAMRELVTRVTGRN